MVCSGWTGPGETGRQTRSRLGRAGTQRRVAGARWSTVDDQPIALLGSRPVSPVLASGRAGNFVRALLIITIIALVFREMFLLWFFHTAAWTSRPKEIHWCGSWYELSNEPDRTQADARKLAGGALTQVGRLPVWRPIVAYRPSRDCPEHIFGKVDQDRYTTYLISGG